MNAPRDNKTTLRYVTMVLLCGGTGTGGGGGDALTVKVNKTDVEYG